VTGQWPLLNRDLHKERPSVSSFKFHYLLFSCGPSSSCWRLLSRHLVTSPFPLITCFRRKFLHKKLIFLFPVCRMFRFPLMLCSTLFFTRSVQLITLFYFPHKVSKLLRVSDNGQVLPDLSNTGSGFWVPFERWMYQYFSCGTWSFLVKLVVMFWADLSSGPHKRCATSESSELIPHIFIIVELRL
jgi:hypothetical protein